MFKLATLFVLEGALVQAGTLIAKKIPLHLGTYSAGLFGMGGANFVIYGR